MSPWLLASGARARCYLQHTQLPPLLPLPLQSLCGLVATRPLPLALVPRPRPLSTPFAALTAPLSLLLAPVLCPRLLSMLFAVPTAALSPASSPAGALPPPQLLSTKELHDQPNMTAQDIMNTKFEMNA